MASVFENIRQACFVCTPCGYWAEFATSVGKVNCAVGSDGNIIGVSDGLAVHFVNQRFNAPVGTNTLQPGIGIGNQKVPIAVELETEWPAADVRKDI